MRPRKAHAPRARARNGYFPQPRRLALDPAAASTDPRVLLAACPLCGVTAGRCLQLNGSGHADAPHEERVAAALDEIRRRVE